MRESEKAALAAVSEAAREALADSQQENGNAPASPAGQQESENAPMSADSQQPGGGKAPARRAFARTELLLGREGMERLWESSVAVFGIGGVGSHCAEALGRSGVGRLILIDSDAVSETNLNRQCVAWRSTVGQKKTEVMAAMLREICPDIRVETHETFVLPDNLEALLDEMGPVDYIVDAIDTVSAKLALAVAAKERGLRLISSMGTGNKLHPELFRFADISETAVCPLCRVMRRELKKRGVERLRVLYSREEPARPDPGLERQLLEQEAPERRSVPGSIAFVPPAAGLMIAGEVVRTLAGKNGSFQ